MESVEELAEGLKQLIVCTRAHVQDVCSMEEVRQSYLHMEEQDRNFHRYSLIKALRAEIEEAVGSQIDEQLCYHGDDPSELMDSGGGQESLVNVIAGRIMQSTEYVEMVDRTERRVQEACDHLTLHYDSEFPPPPPPSSSFHPTTSTHSRAQVTRGTPRAGYYNNNTATNAEILFSDAESSIGDSSSSYSVPLYLTTERLELLASQLSTQTNSSTQVRLTALLELAQVLVLFETQNVNSRSWLDIRHGVAEALLHADDQLSMAAVRVIARGFTLNNSVSREVSRDLYVTLAEALRLMFSERSKLLIVPRIKRGVDCSQPHIKKILRMFRLLNDFQLDVTQYWQRYPDRVVEELQEVTLSLLTLNLEDQGQQGRYLTPLHFLALVDPSARWFVRFMHTHNSRSVLLQLLTKHRTFVCLAVEACYEYNESLEEQELIGRTSRPGETSAVRDVSSSRERTYSGAEMESVVFIHSLSVVSRLLMYRRGRSLLPLSISLSSSPQHSSPDTLQHPSDKVTVTDLVITLISILSKQQQQQQQQRQQAVAAGAERVSVDGAADSGYYCVGELITGVLVRLCGAEEVCREVMCRDRVALSLLQPLSRWIHSSPTADDTPRAGDWSLVYITDVLSALASSSCGQKYLMFGENSSSSSCSSSRSCDDDEEVMMVHKLFSFARHALMKGLVPHVVSAGLIYVCRQIYSTCQGLLISLPYQLHTALHTAWNNARREVDLLSTAGHEPVSTTSPSVMMEWEEILCDNMLNYAGTAGGLVQIVSTGALSNCVQYMLHRYDRKLQVSKCEKFGYGYMMSHLAGTLPGVKALCEAGFVRAHIRALWAAIETVDDDVTFTPRSWPVSCLDKSAVKAFSDVVNLLSSREAVYHLLANNKLLPAPPPPAAAAAAAATAVQYSHRIIPETLLDLLDRIVFVDNNSKIHSLFNYEQSHTTGLMLLNVLISCLDSMLLLQSQYDYQQLLLLAQSLNTADTSGEIIIDMLSVWRNHILVRSYLVGGPTERSLPPVTLPDSSSSYPHPLFSSYPPPAAYTTRPSSAAAAAPPGSAVFSRGAHREESELSRFLSSTSKSDITSEAWMSKCRSSLYSLLLSQRQSHLLHPTLLIDLLEKAVDSYSRSSQQTVFSSPHLNVSESTLKNTKLTATQILGIELTLRYAQRLGISVSNKESRNRLPLLIKRSSAYLKQQQVAPPISPSQDEIGDCGGVFDWFTASIFLLMGGNSDKAWKFLLRFSTLITSAYLWSHRLHRSVHVPEIYLSTQIAPLYCVMSHHVALILHSELPQVYSAFKMSGFSPAQVCAQWLRQCFWNYLDWSEISQYVTVCVVMGVDYQVYTCVALFKHLQQHIMLHTLERTLLTFIKTEPVEGFRFSDYLEYMKDLEMKYRAIVTKHLHSISSQH